MRRYGIPSKGIHRCLVPFLRKGVWSPTISSHRSMAIALRAFVNSRILLRKGVYLFVAGKSFLKGNSTGFISLDLISRNVPKRWRISPIAPAGVLRLLGCLSAIHLRWIAGLTSSGHSEEIDPSSEGNRLTVPPRVRPPSSSGGSGRGLLFIRRSFDLFLSLF